jgi:hypothetical protein
LHFLQTSIAAGHHLKTFSRLAACSGFASFQYLN